MKLRQKFILLFFVFVVLHTFCNAQGDNTIAEEAKRQLTQLASADGLLGKACAKNGITGEFVVDLTVVGKGKVITVFMVSSSAAEMKEQNFVKARLAELLFENIKVPKKQRVKFRHTLNF
jgi:hypothetical protein